MSEQIQWVQNNLKAITDHEIQEGTEIPAKTRKVDKDKRDEGHATKIGYVNLRINGMEI